MMRQKQILIVEDNEINREILKEILSGQYQVLEAENGQVALDILKENKNDIALILLDVMMPVMDGYTFLDRVKKEKDLSLIPVIVMTQSDREDDEVNALSHGAADFVPKPYRPQVILHRVASIINLRETAAMVNQFRFDRLTGLYSREFFYQMVRKRLDSYPEDEYTIVCSNIENFKLYNDTFGTKAGDRLLKENAVRLQQRVGKTGICGRYSADRFLCLQERKQELKDREIFEEMRDSAPSDKMDNVFIKWGIYEITDRSTPVESMCDRALLAVDSIKGQYNQYFAVYDDTLRGKLLREKAITDAMATALEQNQFTVYFQPKYSLKESRMAGAEALVRWMHPEWGFMSPGEFIPLFEKNGFISSLDQYVWEKVCAQIRKWKDMGYPSLPVSVNVSRADVYQANLPKTLMGMIQKYNLEPGDLHLEITESAYAENPGQIISTVNQLRKQGFIIEMDDFGSGYSSLNMLNQMKLDILKLDMKFIQNEMAKPAEQSILRFIISLAHWMKLSVVAEGVETREQLERLREIDCDYVQGYFFAKPMCAEEFEELLKTQSARTVVKDDGIQRNEAAMQKLLIIDEEDQYRNMVCRAFEEQYQILEASSVGSAFACIEKYGEEDISAVILSMTLPEDGSAMLLKVLRQNPAFWRIPVLSVIPQDEMIDNLPLALETDDFLCRCYPLRDLRRRVERLIDISLSHERVNSLQDEAGRDFLTGLLNRRGFRTAVDSIRREDQPLAVCLFDLDDLKKINDTWGHEMGDQVIQSFADLLRRQTRSEDIQCRYGGDEFVVILKRINSKEDVAKKGEAICKIFRESFEENRFHPACSVGIALCGEDEKPSSLLIERADEALYRAKRENKGGCCLWEE